MTLNDVIRGFHRTDTAITFVTKTLEAVTYAELGARVFGNAKRFADLGIERGDRVAIAMESDLEHVVAFLSLMALGATPLSLKPRRGSVEEHAKHVAALASRFRFRATFGDLPACDGVLAITWNPDARSDDRKIVCDVGPDDIAFVQFSSGSLGDPKAVPIRHGMLLENLEAQAATDGRVADTMGYDFLPLSHDMGLVGGLFGAILGEHTTALSSVQEFLRRPTDVFRRHERPESLVLAMPDFAIRYLARHLAKKKEKGKIDDGDARLLSCLKAVYCGAEPIRRGTIGELLDVGPAFGLDPRALIFSYGLAEATLLVTAHRLDSLDGSFAEASNGRVVANVGRPYGDRMELKIDASPGAEGTIFIRGPSVFAGYFDGEPLGDAWYDTGDVGFVRNGDLFVSGRTKELIIVNGENIFPSDIEEVVATMTGVEESLVMPEDDRFFLLVVPSSAKTGVDVEGIGSAIAARFGAAPQAIAVGQARSILRTTSGKPMRTPTLAELRRGGQLP
jgi:fatty-acyl-CoA synthase